MSSFLLNVSPNRNFGDAIANLQYRTLVEYMYEILSAVTPNKKNLAPPLILILLLQFLTMMLLTFLHSVLLVD